VPGDTEPARYYPDAAFVLLDRRVSAIVVYGSGAKTNRGVGVGDPLAYARSAYHAACSPAGGSDITHPAKCDARLGAGTYIEFSGDPIVSVTLSIEPFLSDNGAGCGGLESPFAKAADRVLSRCQQEARTGKPAT
jgi:hypothetical protein